MKNTITHTLSDRQYQILKSLLYSDATYNVLNAGRQSGKTYLMSRLSLILAIIEENKGCRILVAAPYNTQTDTFFYNVMQIEGIGTVIRKTIQSPYKSITFKNGTTIDFRSADNPKSIRSKSYKYIFLDEFAFFKEGAFDLAIVPTLIASGDNCKLYFSSTPNGLTGLFYELHLKGKDESEHNYTYQHMDYNANPKKNMEIIRSEELRQPSNRFRQEFLGEFVSDGGDVFEEIDNVSTLNDIIKSINGGKYFAGIDWGRAQDSTVLTILNKNRQIVFCKSFEGNWQKQLNDLSLILNDYKPIVYAESNGIGDPLLEQIRTKYSNVKPFLMTNASKKEIVENLRMNMLKNEIQLPSRKLNVQLFRELTNYTYSITKTGLISYHHRPDGNDDYVDSLCMANHCYQKHTASFKNVEFEKRSNFYI